MEQTHSDIDRGCKSCCGQSVELNDLEAPQSALGGNHSKSRHFAVSGLDCIEEVRILRRAVGPLVGGDDGLTFDAINGRIGVLVSKTQASDQDIVSAVAATGMSASPIERENTADPAAVDRGPLYATLASGALLLLGVAIHLMSYKLARVPWLVTYSKRTLGIIRQNILFSVGIKVLFMSLTLSGIASLWGAIVADVGATLLIVANALRLLRERPGVPAESMTARPVPSTDVPCTHS